MIDIKFIEKHSERLKVKRKDIITNLGCKESYLYYVQKGLVRKYGYNNQGEEFTFDFVSEDDVVNSYESYVLDTPSNYIVEAVTDCVLYRFPRDMRNIIIMTSSPEEIADFMKIVESIFLHKLKREIIFSRADKFERYKMLIENEAHLFNKAQKGHLASYIGVSPQTISRWSRELSI